ncbi:MAG: hypothetical protein IIU42_05630, partial [Ruminococcus sp.]|nr:hypothetical protein [Ruminococcus sp.]
MATLPSTRAPSLSPTLALRAVASRLEASIPRTAVRFTANSEFDCPGHQGGEFFMKHPAGKSFVDFFGENLFRA